MFKLLLEQELRAVKQDMLYSTTNAFKQQLRANQANTHSTQWCSTPCREHDHYKVTPLIKQTSRGVGVGIGIGACKSVGAGACIDASA